MCSFARLPCDAVRFARRVRSMRSTPPAAPRRHLGGTVQPGLGASLAQASSGLVGASSYALGHELDRLLSTAACRRPPSSRQRGKFSLQMHHGQGSDPGIPARSMARPQAVAPRAVWCACGESRAGVLPWKDKILSSSSASALGNVHVSPGRLGTPFDALVERRSPPAPPIRRRLPSTRQRGKAGLLSLSPIAPWQEQGP